MRPAQACLMSLARLTRAALVAALALVPMTAAAPAQSLFSAVLYVNDEPITNYQIDQKARFLEFIGVAGDDPRAAALDRLIEERLMLQEARRLGGRVTPDMVAEGLAEFAARAELTSDEMMARTAEAGIDAETVRDFIRTGVLWREVVRMTYSGQVAVSEAQVDQARSVEGVQPTVEVLISELYLPNEPQFAETLGRIVPQIQRIDSETEFANAARQVSVAPTAAAGGRVDRWIDVAGIPAPLGPVFAETPIGTLIGPIEQPGALAFFLLRGRRDTREVPPAAIELDYRRVALPGGRSEANLARVAALRDLSDSCADFPGHVLRLAPELPAEAIAALQTRLPQVPGAERSELERMNPGQINANMVEGGALVVLMLCARNVAGEAGALPREEVRLGLFNRALEGQSALYLQRLRVEAEIREP